MNQAATTPPSQNPPTEPIRPVAQVPDRPSLDGLEDRWSAQWGEQDLYAFDATAPRDRVFSIDTPPPTASGSLHKIGRASCRESAEVAGSQRTPGTRHSKYG